MNLDYKQFASAMMNNYYAVYHAHVDDDLLVNVSDSRDPRDDISIKWTDFIENNLKEEAEPYFFEQLAFYLNPKNIKFAFNSLAQNIRTTYMRKDKEWREIVICPLVIENGATTQAVITIQDAPALKNSYMMGLRQAEVIQALSADYVNVYVADFDHNTVEILRMSGQIINKFGEDFNATNDYNEMLKAYAAGAVYHADYDNFMENANAQSLKMHLKETSPYTLTYRTKWNNKVEYYQMKAVKLGSSDKVNQAVVGFGCVDDAVRREQRQKRSFEKVGKNLEESQQKVSTLQSVLVHAMNEAIAAIIVLNLEDDKITRFVPVEGGEIKEEHPDFHWDEYVTLLSKSLTVSEYKKISKSVTYESLKNREIGDTFEFHIKARKPLSPELLLSKNRTRYYCLKFSIVNLDGTKCAIITNINETDSIMIEAEQQKEKNVQLQLQRYQLIMENSDEFIYEVNYSGRYMLTSGKIKEKFGWSIPQKTDNITFDKIAELWHVYKDDREKLFDLVEQIERTLAPAERRVRVGRENGEYIWCDITAIPLVNDEIVESILGRITDVDSDVRKIRTLEKTSRIDSLTGLLNKAAFRNGIEEYIATHSMKNTALVFIDLDHFKLINDTLGHSMGDIAIQDCASKLQVIFANCDYVGRFGGDEFCIFVKDIPRETLKDKLGWTNDKIKNEYTSEGKSVKITCSIGAAYCSSDNVTFEDLLETADKAAYDAKDRGRNNYVIRDI